VIYLPGLQLVFSTVALNPVELGVSLGLSTVVFWAVELEKLIKRRIISKARAGQKLSRPR